MMTKVEDEAAKMRRKIVFGWETKARVKEETFKVLSEMWWNRLSNFILVYIDL